MATSWPVERLDDLCEQIADCPHSTPEWADYGYIVIRNQNIRNGRLDLSTPSFTDKEHFEQRSRRARLREGDLILTREAPMGEVCMVPQNLQCCLGQRMVMLRPDPTKCDGRFLLYTLQSSGLQNEINVSEGTGSTVSNLRIPLIESLPIPTPPLPEQKRIAHILGTLDDKIELNRKMNATLESMARALFKSWFVDFDPVRAKMEGRQPEGMDAEAAALFPDSFEESALGPIPKGWEAATIGDKLSTILGGTPSRAKPEYWTNGTVAWINSGKTNNFRILQPSEWITEEALKSSATKILPSRTTVLAITGATLGQVSITEIECCANQSVVAIPATAGFPTEFLYPWIKENIDTLVSSQTGGAQQHINKRNVDELGLIVPAPPVITVYFRHAKPIFDQIGAICIQTQILVDLRNALLPKLLGEELITSDIKAVVP